MFPPGSGRLVASGFGERTTMAKAVCIAIAGGRWPNGIAAARPRRKARATTDRRSCMFTPM
jgi:hypothetical protein